MDDVHPWFLRGSDAHAVVPELALRDAEAVFDKIGMSAFEGTPLDTALRDCGVRTFVIVGVAIEIGIEPTIRHGADLGVPAFSILSAWCRGLLRPDEVRAARGAHLAPRASRLRRAQRRATQKGRAHWARPSLTVALSRNPCQGFAIVMDVPVLSPSGS